MSGVFQNINTSPSGECVLRTLLQDLTQDSATLTWWRRTKRSGEGKMIALYGPGISLLRYLNFPAFSEIPEFSWDLHDHQSEEFFSYAGILHSSMSEDISGIFRRLPCEKMKECTWWDRTQDLRNTTPHLYLYTTTTLHVYSIYNILFSFIHLHVLIIRGWVNLQ